MRALRQGLTSPAPTLRICIRLSLPSRNEVGWQVSSADIMAFLMTYDACQSTHPVIRIFRLVGGDPRNPDYVVANQQIIDKMGNAVRINDVSVGCYDIEIGVGSTLPVDKARLFNEMIMLLKVGAADAQAVLENSSLSVPQQMKILQRMQQAQQAQMQQQGQGAPPAGQQQAPPQGGGQGQGGPDPASMQNELNSMVGEGSQNG